MEISLPDATSSARWPAVLVVGLLAGVIAAAVWSWSNDGVAREVFSSEQTPAEKVTAIRTFFDGIGPWAPLAYFLFVVVEVIVAPIPGAMLYAPGGLIFGGLVGGILSLAGNTVGAGISCWLIRTLGGERLNRLVDADTLASLQNKVRRRGFLVVLLLRINPLTSSDLVSYAAGLTRIPIWQLMLATMLGMAPLCFAQSYLSAEFFTAFPQMIYPLAIAGIIYLAVVLWVVRGLIQTAAVLEPANTGE